MQSCTYVCMYMPMFIPICTYTHTYVCTSGLHTGFGARGGGGGGGQIELPKILGGQCNMGGTMQRTETGGGGIIGGNAMYGEGVLYSR